MYYLANTLCPKQRVDRRDGRIGLRNFSIQEQIQGTNCHGVRRTSRHLSNNNAFFYVKDNTTTTTTTKYYCGPPKISQFRFIVHTKVQVLWYYRRDRLRLVVTGLKEDDDDDDGRTSVLLYSAASAEGTATTTLVHQKLPNQAPLFPPQVMEYR